MTALMLMRLEAPMSLSCNLLAWEGGKSCSVGYFNIFHRDGTCDSGKIPVNQKAS